MKVTGNFEQYERLEFELDDNTEYIKITVPDGHETVLRPFSYQPIDIRYDENGIESISKAGTEKSICRFTPDFTGKMIVECFFNDKSSQRTEWIITDSNNHGYIEIGEKDSRYFCFTDQTPFFPIGINTAFPATYARSSGTEFGLSSYGFMGLREYERWFKKLSGNGVNVARVWLGHEYFSPDTLNVCEFEATQFSKIDCLLSIAKKYGIKLKLTLEQFRFFSYDQQGNSGGYSGDVFKKFNKNLYCHGERCENADEWLTSERWKTAWLFKVEELAKRYAGDTEIFAIELWNEMNCVGTWENMVNWNREMLPKVKQLFPKHLVTNSIGSFDCEAVCKMYTSFCWKNCDFVQFHRYLDQGAQYEDCKNPIEVIKGGFSRLATTKPVFVAETGAVNNCHSGPFNFYVNDDDGILFADVVYTPVFMKSCGTGNIWHWDNRYVESKNLYHLFKPIKNLINGIDFESEAFETLDFSNDTVYCLLLKGKNTTIGYLRNKNYNWQTVLRDLKEVAPIDEFFLPTTQKSRAELFPIWDNDRSEATATEHGIAFENIKIGVLFKLVSK